MPIQRYACGYHADFCYAKDVAALEAENADLKARLTKTAEALYNMTVSSESYRLRCAEYEQRRCKTCDHACSLLPLYRQPDRLECSEREGQWVSSDHGCRAWAKRED